jgi:prophage endopeptidase
MLSLFNPSVILSIIIAVGASFGWGHHTAYVEQQAEIGRLNAVMAEEAAQTNAKYSKEKQDAQIKITKLRADLDAGTLRLSIPSPVSNPASGTTEARAELDRSTSQALITITTDGDEAIRDLNLCIDRYNQVRNVK